MTDVDVCKVCGKPRFSGVHSVPKKNGGHAFVPAAADEARAQLAKFRASRPDLVKLWESQ